MLMNMWAAALCKILTLGLLIEPQVTGDWCCVKRIWNHSAVMQAWCWTVSRD